jgi:Reverse transcriptase (RNA-dependent DNA polymerase)
MQRARYLPTLCGYHPVGLTLKLCLVYLDDIIVFSKTPAEHMAHLDAVLHRIYRAGLKLNLKKCLFFKDTVDYLGHVNSP